MPTDPLHDLQSAARRYARHVLPGSVARRIIIVDEHRERIAEVRIPACEDRDAAPSLVPDVRPGWDFTSRIARYDGTECPDIVGRPLAVLRVLAEANGPVSVDELRAAWDGYQADESTIRGAVASLRRKLAKLWPDWEGEIIVSTGAGYGLELR